MTFFCTNFLFAQKDTAVLLQGVVVSGLKVTKPVETPINISSLPVQKIRTSGSFNIADALAKVPGISQLTTGVGISKPVIRGLYGNRIQTVLSGLRFDNQQWQDEHGLGLNDMGIDRVEIIKGPVALLYGSESVGGIINIIEEAPALPGTKIGEINARVFSNTYGLYTELGLKAATEKRNWRIRAGINSNADYSDGNNNRILNSRFGGYYLKGSLGFKKKNWTSYNNYNASYDNFGFIMDSLNPKSPDNRLSRKMDGPHHTVLLNVLSSQNTVRLKTSTIKLNLGLQSNLRLEDEGGNKISLEMLLSTFLYNLQWIKPLSQKTEFIIGNQTIFENNTNFGSRVIIPDANMLESGVSFFLKNSFSKLVLESGAGITFRNIHTFLTSGVNTPDRDIRPFNKTRPSVNGSFGATFNPTKDLNCKFNFSTGFRSGNLAELSSNGLHEGTLRWEIGDPTMKIEQNFNAEFSVAYSNSIISLSVASFYNHFSNYIFLAPTGTQYLGFDVYRFRQFDANLYGGEATVGFRIPAAKWFSYRTDFSTVTGNLANGSYLPFIPADKFHHEIGAIFNCSKKISKLTGNISVDNILSQTHPAQFETPTKGYTLVNAGITAVITKPKKDITVSIAGNNLFNKNYYDHLSRFKDYLIHNIGRNIVINLSIPFSLTK